MKMSTSLVWLSNAVNTIDPVEEDTLNVPTKSEEWGFHSSFRFYESECDEVSGIDVENEKTLNGSSASSKNMPDSMRRNLSFPSIGEIVASMKEDALHTSNVSIEKNKQNSSNTFFDDTEDGFKTTNMKRNFSFQSLVSVGKKALSLPLFHFQKVQEENSNEKYLEEMHEIFRDGNFVMVDGLILLASEERKRKLFARTA